MRLYSGETKHETHVIQAIEIAANNVPSFFCSQSTNQSLTNNTPTPTTNTNNTTNHENQNNLNLNMSAKELRAKLASRKKYDPKKDYLDIKKKYDIVQKL
ncbi:uncharacterized protein LOC113466607 [Diaphorina citri]|uniref:Uncharacterized protein LOC113466607 n=1 Tax=Diaphorina citri TaxID=121845 RepID=A0A3Q0INS8_DIACI|nr:uncharacterized protein LOC113466607 [Diaphorina citri]